MTATTTKQLEVLKRELHFIGREAQRINGDSETYESVDAIGQAVQIALTAIFEIELDAQPEHEGALKAKGFQS